MNNRVNEEIKLLESFNVKEQTIDEVKRIIIRNTTKAIEVSNYIGGLVGKDKVTKKVKDFTKKAAAAFRSEDALSGADMSFSDLSYADLEGANLTNCSLRGARLFGITNFETIIVNGADFGDVLIDNHDLVVFLRSHDAKDVPDSK
jgi:Pentapeptide repeats (8 copies)